MTAEVETSHSLPYHLDLEKQQINQDSASNVEDKPSLGRNQPKGVKELPMDPGPPSDQTSGLDASQVLGLGDGDLSASDTPASDLPFWSQAIPPSGGDESLSESKSSAIASTTQGSNIFTTLDPK
ncbi:hypothetical protein VKT23_014128 [Stygiomarasmius scandens]|uniref:Uncharacterized protein n=1 Tax=Marasmiellus scandens TaxID=2682957 RepID=A0ABR1J4X1_9AGAR